MSFKEKAYTRWMDASQTKTITVAHLEPSTHAPSTGLSGILLSKNKPIQESGHVKIKIVRSPVGILS